MDNGTRYSWEIMRKFNLLFPHRFSFHLQHDRATSNVGPAERMSAQAYTLKLPLVVLLCRATFNYPPIKRCWRGVAILKENIAGE